jgi:hypothetical protein
MKRHACQLSLIIAAAIAAPSALAGSAVVKCIAPSGQVTLTDQPCDDGATSVTMEAAWSAQAGSGARIEAYGTLLPMANHRGSAAPAAVRHDSWRPPPGHLALAGDVATLKAARLQLRMLDDASRQLRQPQLAGLN